MITSYDELPYGMYERIQGEIKNYVNDDDAKVYVLSVLSGMSEDDLLNMRVGEFSDLMEKTAFILSVPQPGKRRREYKVKDWTLVPVGNVREMTAGQYIDFQSFAKLENNIVEVASVVLVPKGHRYADGYDTLQLQKDIRECMSVSDILGVNAFFLTSLESSMSNTLTFLGWRIKRMRRKATEEQMPMLENLASRVKTIRRSVDSLKRGGGSTR